ncbi:hypothetical protein FUAX_46970 (plasmid) [Fulvitalea axinellae]|uniref:Cupin type-2 domain-containing protein n=1 Tax=Fulvitalea axinellae TaxID=1182444 RepID=A0AAU9DM43_9BACT|nr:hypothetical protein FUAX_46970 [Fulvitalea axinellae]
MEKRKTSFGEMETLLEREGKIVSERLYFEREGRGHTHNVWEICYVIAGQGVIVNGEERVEVKKGDVCKIPPNAEHWMIPDPDMEVLLVYSPNP